ncbi:MAG: hypothetical protein Q8880_07090 [Bacteroidota bacterium]|nr:hypothetical protein [Bacteroidota bacterium]
MMKLNTRNTINCGKLYRLVLIVFITLICNISVFSQLPSPPPPTNANAPLADVIYLLICGGIFGVLKITGVWGLKKQKK